MAAGDDAARAIMTTDTVPKQAVATRAGVTVGGMAKGAGMIAPGMATMLSVLTTDGVVDPQVAQMALRRAVEQTFNRVDSDGCMSTNDTVLLMASGAGGAVLDDVALGDLLTEVCDELARAMVADAEGPARTSWCRSMAPPRSPMRWRRPGSSRGATCSNAPCTGGPLVGPHRGRRRYLDRGIRPG